jgi:hypothetical protein
VKTSEAPAVGGLTTNEFDLRCLGWLRELLGPPRHG